MLNVEERFMIRDLYRKGVSISEIARQTGHDRKTIRKVIAEPLRVPGGYARQAQAQLRQPKARKIEPYIAYLEKRMAEGVYNARKLYQELQELGYPGKETQVRSFVQMHRPPRPSQATMRFETEPGEQAQVDWGHFGYIQHQGKRRRLYAFVMTLGWSRAMYLEFTVSADIAWWLRCHLHAFQYLGGVTQEILHDNLKTAVLSRRSDGQVHWHPRYLDFADYYGFKPRACQPYRAQTKGKVESGIRYVRGNFWLGLNFSDLYDLNHQGLAWLNRVANVRLHGTTGAVPFERLPQEQLLPIYDKPDYDTSLILYRQSSRDCFISYEGNLYSVPAIYAQKRVMVKVTEQDTLLVYNLEGDEIARHGLALGHNQRVVIAAHYQGLYPSAQPSPASQTAQEQPLGVTSPFLPDAPVVEVRPLSLYGQLLEVTS
jgi:transposase